MKKYDIPTLLLEHYLSHSQKAAVDAIPPIS
jgi:hypothetical protein